MLYKRVLKHKTFTFDSDTKVFAALTKESENVARTPEGKIEVVFTVAEAAAFSRFTFSMMQYHMKPKKKGGKPSAENEDNESELN